MYGFYIPLMDDNINRDDINSLVHFLTQDPLPRLTNGDKVKEFEQEWGEWLGTRYNVMVNSGSAANELTMLALKYIHGDGEVLLPPLTWASDPSSVVFAGFEPVFCDINLHNLSFDLDKLRKSVSRPCGKAAKALCLVFEITIKTLYVLTVTCRELKKKFVPGRG